jgi:general secretion pathway protein G
MRRKNREGFTLIELLVVVAIIGILSAIAIVNYLNAITRARQKRTMADIRTIAGAWETRASEMQSYTAAGFTYPANPVTYTALVTMLNPGYIKNVPRVDGWSRNLEFGAQDKLYAIRSPGRDGVFEGTDYSTEGTTNPDCDIVFSNGNFVRYPESVQSN